MRWRIVGAMLLVVCLAAACSQQDAAPAPGSPPPTPIEQLDTGALTIPRIDFCNLVPDDAVRSAVGSRRTRSTDWGNGDTATVGTGAQRTHDVVAEHGCSWQSRRDGARRASAWIFSRPVHRPLARRVAQQAGKEPGCHLADGPRFGRASMTQVCKLDRPGRVRVRHAGLFGEAWLTCQVSADSPLPAVTRRADAWCVQVATALDTSR